MIVPTFADQWHRQALLLLLHASISGNLTLSKNCLIQALVYIMFGFVETQCTPQKVAMEAACAAKNEVERYCSMPEVMKQLSPVSQAARPQEVSLLSLI